MPFPRFARRAVALTAVVAVLASACGGQSLEEKVAKANDTDLSPAERCAAIDALYWEGGEAVPALHELAEDPDLTVALCAVQGLADIDDPDAMDEAADALASLIEEGREGDDPRLVVAELKALGGFGRTAAGAVRAVEQLALRRSSTPAEDKSLRKVRTVAIVTLGRIGSPSARSGLVEVIAIDAANAEAAALALVRIFRSDVAPLLPLLDRRRNLVLAYPLVDVGQRGTEDALVTALNRYGGIDLAEYYLNCGNRTLERAAQAWADRNGYTVMTTPGYRGGQWGSGV